MSSVLEADVFKHFCYTTDHRQAMLRAMEILGITEFWTRCEDGVMVMILELNSSTPDLLWLYRGITSTYTPDKDEAKRRKAAWKETLADWRSQRNRKRERVPVMAAA